MSLTDNSIAAVRVTTTTQLTLPTTVAALVSATANIPTTTAVVGYQTTTAVIGGVAATTKVALGAPLFNTAAFPIADTLTAGDTIAGEAASTARVIGSTVGAAVAAAGAAVSSSITPGSIPDAVVKVAGSTLPLDPTAAAAAATGTATGATAAAAALPSGDDFVWAFVHAHESPVNAPNYRYTVFFWVAMIIILIAYALGHHLRLPDTKLGTMFSKWGVKRYSIRYGSKKSGKVYHTPSNSYLLVLAIVFGLILGLSLIGPDQISLDEPFLGFSFGAAKESAEPHAVADYRQAVVQYKHSLIGYKRAADEYVREAYNAELIRPKHHDTIDKSFWTSGNRFGFMAFAAMPLLVAMGLKSVPFAFLAPRWFTALHWDKVSTFHRAGGWFIWWLVTIHAGLWATQLFIWNYNGRSMFLCMTIALRFRFAVASYVLMTAAVFSSLRCIRDKMYELWYLTHFVFIALSFAFAIIHHLVVGYWLFICFALWFLDRAWRLCRIAYINGYCGTTTVVSTDEFTEKYESHTKKTIVEIPPGYAQAQLLPSKTVRLSIRTHRPMKWSPGQSLLLRLPELAQLQTHPFTIANNDPNEIVLLIKARKGLTLDLYHLVRMRTKVQQDAYQRKGLDSGMKNAEPIHVKATVDGPMGSSGRVNWTDYWTVLLICGGSGVTFGLAICDHLTAIMSQPGYSETTQRVRLIWVLREYAELTWAASALCRFGERLKDRKLEISVWVTNAAKKDKAESPKNSSSLELAQIQEVEEAPRPVEEAPCPVKKAPSNPYRDVEAGNDEDDDNVRALTHMQGEEDYDDPAEKRLSRQVAMKGKQLRRQSRMLIRSKRVQSVAPQLPIPTVSPMTQNYNKSWEDESDSESDSDFAPNYPDSEILDPYFHPYMEQKNWILPNDVATEQSVDGRGANRQKDNHFQMSTVSSYSQDEFGNQLPSPPSVTSPLRPRVASNAPSSRVTFAPSAPSPRSPRGQVVTYAVEPHPQQTYQEAQPAPQQPKPLSPAAPIFSSMGRVRDSMISTMSQTYIALTSRTQNIVPIIEPTAGGTSSEDSPSQGSQIMVDEGDQVAASIIAAGAGKGRPPPFETILEKELERTKGRVIVGACGPERLNIEVRNAVSASIGDVALYTEDFEM